MITKKEILFIKELQSKEIRNDLGMFIAEGPTIVNDLLKRGIEYYKIYSTVDYPFLYNIPSVEIITVKDLERISSMKTPNSILGIFYKKPSITLREMQTCDNILILNDIQDPGNMGTILRTAEWLGYFNIISTLNSVDLYNPKVVQSSMGSVVGINMIYLNLDEINILCYSHTLLATDTDGDDIREVKITGPFALIIGNEGNGIDEKLLSMATKKIKIPRNNVSNLPESLNAATAAAICMWQLTISNS
ncbi:MAG TPA: TrmH family RNA methyltransferase [Bacteroidales bacterium]|nr:TrmH family RNA methyltransferase [Bacteroidales bacterium]